MVYSFPIQRLSEAALCPKNVRQFFRSRTYERNPFLQPFFFVKALCARLFFVVLPRPYPVDKCEKRGGIQSFVVDFIFHLFLFFLVGNRPECGPLMRLLPSYYALFRAYSRN